MNYKPILQRETNEVLQQANFVSNNVWHLQQASSATSNETIVQRVTSDLLKRTTSAMGKLWKQQKVIFYTEWSLQ